LKRIRVLLAKMPALMLDIIHHVIAAEPDMAVIGVVDDGDLPAAVLRARADVVVVGQDAQAERDSYLQLLLRHPRVKVLAIADNGKSGSLYELQPRRVSLGKISARTLTQAIRGGAQPTSKTRAPRRRSAEVH
jgi:DNA-binding NarL/FixJ family response regulator